jgi:hypothetical protein
MRKIILIAMIALMSTSSCYANLSLADASQQITEQTKARGAEAHPISEEKHAAISKPRRKHIFVEARFLSGWARHCW